MRDLLLLAASGLAREAASVAQGDYRVIGILDDDPALHGERVSGIEVLGPIALAAELNSALLVCVGSGVGRRRVVDRLAILGVSTDRYATLLDDSVRVPKSCAIGSGSMLLAGTALTADVRVGHHVVIMPNTTLTHDNVLGDYVTVAAGVSLGGSVILGAGSYIGMNASIRQNLSVGLDATVGMGAVVLQDVPAGETWVNVPARLRTPVRSGSSTKRRPDGRAVSA